MITLPHPREMLACSDHFRKQLAEETDETSG
jgi:hypothetical protein